MYILKLLAALGSELISGTAIFLFDQKPCLLSYEVNTDSNWEACTANIPGYVGKFVVTLESARYPQLWEPER